MDTINFFETGLAVLNMERRGSKPEYLTTDEVAPEEKIATNAGSSRYLEQDRLGSSPPRVVQPDSQNGKNSGSYLVKSNVRSKVELNGEKLTDTHFDDNKDDIFDEGSQKVTKDEEEKTNYAHLCRLLLEGSSHALRHVFNQIHPEISLADRLSRPDVLKVLRKLRLQNAVSGKQWDTLYPKQRKAISSKNYDTPLMMLLLQNICHISAPYPNGWRGVPLPGDISISADIARMSYFHKLLAPQQSISSADYEAYWSQIGEVLVRLGGTPIKVKLDRLARDRMQAQVQNTWINSLRVSFSSSFFILFEIAILENTPACISQFTQ